MRYLPIYFRLALIALFLSSGTAISLMGQDPVKQAQKWAEAAKDQEAKAKEAKTKLDCEKPRSADKKALVKAINDARTAADNAQTWADKAKATAEEAAKNADKHPNNQKAQDAKTEADQAAAEAKKAAAEAKTAYNNALGEAPGMKAAADLEAELDRADVSGNSKKQDIVDRLKQKAKEAAEKDPCDPEAVKRAVRAELDDIKNEVKRNGEMKPWVDDLADTLKNKTLIFFQNPDRDALVFTPTGTGRTTGHIANLSIFNPTNQPVTVMLPTVFIPSNGTDQPYVASAVGPTTIAAHSTANIALYGYCADIFSPPVPAGAAMPPVSDWITVKQPDLSSDVVSPVTTVLPSPGSDWTPTTANGWTPASASTSSAVVPTFPGTDMPLGYTVDPVRNPRGAAPILIDMLERITQTYDAQKAAGAIATPFSSNPEKERETVIQHTFWQASAALTGQEYKQENFRENTIQSFEASTGRNFKSLPAAEQQQLESGITDFWNTFEGVGASAKVLRKEQ